MTTSGIGSTTLKDAPAAAPLPRQEKSRRVRGILAKFCPHADWAVVEPLWERKLYRKLVKYGVMAPEAEEAAGAETAPPQDAPAGNP